MNRFLLRIFKKPIKQQASVTSVTSMPWGVLYVAPKFKKMYKNYAQNVTCNVNSMILTCTQCDYFPDHESLLDTSKESLSFYWIHLGKCLRQLRWLPFKMFFCGANLASTTIPQHYFILFSICQSCYLAE